MNSVSFPGFNLKFEFSKIAFSIFGISIYKYAVCIVLGIVIALILCKFSKEKFNNTFEDVLDIFLFAIFAGIIGARLYFVIFNLKYFLSNPSQILNFRNGGLAIYGGLIVGILTAIIICRKKKIDVLNFLDYVIPFVALAQAIGRWGNFFNIEAYGSQTVSIFRMGIETANGYLEVHPVFLYESISNFLIFIFLRILQKNRKFNGEILLVYCMLYSFVRSFLEGLRIDSLMFFSFRISQILSIFIFIISLIIFYKKIKDTKKILKKNVE
jgi:phosphatidylglycerol:prolipoprotein diacylglycerol transferase